MHTMKKAAKHLGLAFAMATALAAGAADAALPQGAKAPEFKLQAALAGKAMDFDLAKALKRGPVVLYFFPAAFTPGCTIEAHDFAEATPAFAKLGATVIGVTAGNIERVEDFSRVECRDKFAVAADPGAKVAAQYDATMQADGKTLSNRTSYVIAPDGKILLGYTDRNPGQHVQKTMAAVKAWSAAHP